MVHRAAVAGVDSDAVATGAGSGPNAIRVVSDGRITSTSVQIGFPILTRASVGHDRLIVASIQSAPPGSRWCDIDLHPGAVIAYDPSAEHTATNPPGLEFTFAVAPVDELLEQGERLKTDLKAPDRGGVTELARGPRVSTVARQLATLAATPDQRPPTPRLAIAMGWARLGRQQSWPTTGAMRTKGPPGSVWMRNRAQTPRRASPGPATSH